MATRAEWAAQPLDKRLDHLRQTLDDVERLIKNRTDTELSHRPDPKNWAAKEVVCHLRDIEELAVLRYRMMLWTDEPKVPAAFLPSDRQTWGLLEDGATLVDPDRWAEERQYLRNDAGLARVPPQARRHPCVPLQTRLVAVASGQHAPDPRTLHVRRLGVASGRTRRQPRRATRASSGGEALKARLHSAPAGGRRY